MEKILVSDYDGTLMTNLKNMKKNIIQINEFRKNNIFVISTGRPYISILNEIKKYNIEYDYLCCQDGSIIFDNKDNLLFADTLSNINYKKIMKEIENLKFIKEIFIRGTYDIVFDNQFNNIIEIELTKKYSSKKEYLELKNKLNNLSVYDIFGNIYIKNKFTKSDGIKKLIELKKLDNIPIYTVGDAKNDYEMLKDFNGYKMLKSSPYLYFKNINTTRQVNTLIKKLNK